MMEVEDLNALNRAKKKVNKLLARSSASLDLKTDDGKPADVDEIYTNIVGQLNDLYGGLLQIENQFKTSIVRDSAGRGTSLSSVAGSAIISAITQLVLGIRNLNTYLDTNVSNFGMFSSSERNSLVSLLRDLENAEKSIEVELERTSRRTMSGEPRADTTPYRVFNSIFAQWREGLNELKMRFREAGGVGVGSIGAGLHELIPRRFL